MLREGCGEHSILVPLGSGATNPSCWDCPSSCRATWGDLGQLNLVPFLWFQVRKGEKLLQQRWAEGIGDLGGPRGVGSGEPALPLGWSGACRGMEELAQRGFRKSF